VLTFASKAAFFLNSPSLISVFRYGWFFRPSS